MTDADSRIAKAFAAVAQVPPVTNRRPNEHLALILAGLDGPHNITYPDDIWFDRAAALVRIADRLVYRELIMAAIPDFRILLGF